MNVDETGQSIVQSKVPTVIGRKSKRQMSFHQNEDHLTFVACMSTAEQFLSPMLIYPRKYKNGQLIRGAPPGTIYDVHPSGWIQQNLFTKWFHHSLINHLKMTLFCLSWMSLPPHSTHKYQPSDKSFMDQFKVYYSEEIRNWILSLFEIAELLGKSFLKNHRQHKLLSRIFE